MRYDKPIVFVKKIKKQYDPDSGEWSNEKDIRVKRYANITHMGADRQQAVFGDVRSDRYVVRLQRAYVEDYDFIEMCGNQHFVCTDRCPGDKKSLVVMRNG